MPDTNKYVPPSTALHAFSCPHCGTLAHQYWYKVAGRTLDKDSLPFLADEEFVESIRSDKGLDTEVKGKFLRLVERVAQNDPFLEGDTSYFTPVYCLHFSRCFSCNRLAIWRGELLLWPGLVTAPPANADLPDDIRADYVEAASILDLSPRGAAALLRLAIQKLCKELGEKGKNIDDDIASLVTKGLSKQVQQALDIVRVTGNEAVHPGQLDLKDDKATAESLFRMVNLIAEKMITEPRHVQEAFDALPANKRAAIEVRDAPKKLPSPETARPKG